MAGEAKKLGRVDQREEMNPSPQKIVGLRTIIWYLFAKLIYQIVTSRTSYCHLGYFPGWLGLLRSLYGGWVGSGVYMVGGLVVESMWLRWEGGCEKWLYSLAQSAMLDAGAIAELCKNKTNKWSLSPQNKHFKKILKCPKTGFFFYLIRFIGLGMLWKTFAKNTFSFEEPLYEKSMKFKILMEFDNEQPILVSYIFVNIRNKNISV